MAFLLRGATLNYHRNVNIAIVDESLNDIEMYSKLIRELGYTIKVSRIEDCEDIEEAFRGETQDLILFSFEFPHTTLKEVRFCVDKIKKGIPLVCLHSDDSDITLEKALQDGASSLVSKDNEKEFKFNMQRELDLLTLKRQYEELDARYRESEKRCQTLITSSKDAIAYIHEGMHVTANEAYLDLFGFKKFDDIEGTPIMDMVPESNQGKFKEFLRSFKTADLETKEVDLQLRDERESTFNAKLEFSPATIDGEACTQIVIRDQSDAKELEKKLSELSQIDQLTGLFNRRYMLEMLEKHIKVVQQKKIRLSFFYIAIDDFEEHAEKLGVLGADQLVSGLARVVKENIPEKQLLGRFIGGSYCMIFNKADERALTDMASKLTDKIKDAAINVNNHPINASCSIGVCLVDESITASSDVLARAEKALETAQKDDKLAFSIYQPKAGELTQGQLDQKWLKLISENLKNKKFTPLFQPIISLAGDSFQRYEVSFSVPDENGEPLGFADFKDPANRTGIAKSIDRWMILSTLQQIVGLLKGKGSFTFFVPLSSATLEDPTLFRWLMDQTKKVTLPPNSLAFCIDYEIAQPRLKQTRALVMALNKLKMQVCITNFGSVPDPFEMNRHVPMDYVKIHPDFVHNLASNQDNQTAIREIAEKGDKLRKKVIVGGIDDPNSLTVLWSLGAHLVQGEFLAQVSEKTDYDFSSMTI